MIPDCRGPFKKGKAGTIHEDNRTYYFSFHWDREWYLPLKKHRMHLVELVDAILEKFETDENRSFLSGRLNNCL